MTYEEIKEMKPSSLTEDFDGDVFTKIPTDDSDIGKSSLEERSIYNTRDLFPKIHPVSLKDQFINYASMYHRDDGYMDLYHGRVCRPSFQPLTGRIKIDKDRKEDNSMENVTTIFEEKGIKKIAKEYEKMRKEILNRDSLYKEIKDAYDNLNSKLEKNGYSKLYPYLDNYTDNKTDGCLEELDNQRVEIINKFSDTVSNINSLVELCGDDKNAVVEVYITYGILTRDDSLAGNSTNPMAGVKINDNPPYPEINWDLEKLGLIDDDEEGYEDEEEA